MSKGEEKISSLLKSAKISYLKEYTFSDLKSYKGEPLRFDFATFENNNLKYLIEYDSEIHFQQVKYFHKNESAFKQAQERDRIKNKYCLINNIPLIRIPYWDLDKLTYDSLFNTPLYYVNSKFHNDLLRPPN